MQLGGVTRMFRSTIDSRARNSKDCNLSLVQFSGINAVQGCLGKRRDRQPCQAKRSLIFPTRASPMRLGLRGQSLGNSSIDSELALSVKARSLFWRTTMPRQITCITKPDVHSSHEAITHVGGSSFYITREQCADDIRFRRESYFVHVGLIRLPSKRISETIMGRGSFVRSPTTPKKTTY